MHEKSTDKKNLDLSHLKLSSIPEIPISVIKLDLRRNQIEILDFPYLTSLQEIDLSDNRIKNIDSLENFPELRIFDLSYNLISEINLPRMNLRELYLIGNDILFMENLFLPKLKILDLAVNEIDVIENLEYCLDLEELYLGSNKIKNVPDLRFLTKLRILDLQNNKIQKINCENLPDSIEQLLVSENEDLSSIENISLLKNINLLAIKKTSIVDLNLENVEIWK